MFSQAWEDTLYAFGNDLDESVLENLYERQVYTHEERFDIVSV